jgi:biopolymer transport protein TolR
VAFARNPLRQQPGAMRMAIMLKKNNKGKRNRRAPMSDMNVTPMIDVMLVLLVVFMVTAPFLTTGIRVSLPNANAQSINGNDVPIVVHIDAEKRVFIGDIEVSADTLADKLKAIIQENGSEAKIFVRGDKTLSYGAIMGVMGSIAGAGFKKVVLVTELPQKQDQNASQEKR